MRCGTNSAMKRVYLSPHLDDVVFSCGGLVWEEVQSGHHVEIWTLCAGDPPDEDYSSFVEMLHQAWGLESGVVARRRQEDVKACQTLGALPRHFQIPDCIYRRSPEDGAWLYTYEDALFGGLHPVEKPLVDELQSRLRKELQDVDRVIAPLGIGNHVDHELTRKAVRDLGLPVYYYADYPYAREAINQSLLELMDDSEDWQQERHMIPQEAIAAWQKASLCYQSQFHIFWEDRQELREQIAAYSTSMSGMVLWKPAGGSN